MVDVNDSLDAVAHSLRRGVEDIIEESDSRLNTLATDLVTRTDDTFDEIGLEVWSKAEEGAMLSSAYLEDAKTVLLSDAEDCLSQSSVQLSRTSKDVGSTVALSSEEGDRYLEHVAGETSTEADSILEVVFGILRFVVNTLSGNVTGVVDEILTTTDPLNLSILGGFMSLATTMTQAFQIDMQDLFDVQEQMSKAQEKYRVDRVQEMADKAPPAEPPGEEETVKGPRMRR